MVEANQLCAVDVNTDSHTLSDTQPLLNEPADGATIHAIDALLESSQQLTQQLEQHQQLQESRQHQLNDDEHQEQQESRQQSDEQQKAQLLQESALMEIALTPGSLASQLCPLGPKDRCTPSQAQAMGQQILALLAMYEKNKLPLPDELQNTFDVFHRCLAVAYSTFFLNLYTKANAPCLLCHGCQSLYPPGQYIHHACQALPPNIVPCRSRMWRRCLVPLLSPNLDKEHQKQRWKYVLEKFSHNSTGVVRRNPLPPDAESQLLEIPECKRGRFVKQPAASKAPQTNNDDTPQEADPLANGEQVPSNSLTTLMNGAPPSLNGSSILDASIDSPVRESSSGSEKAMQSGPSKALDIIGDLVQEVRRLERELVVTQAKLQAAQEQLNSRESDEDVRAKLASAAMLHRALMAERDQAVQQSTHYQQLASSLQQQLEKLHTLHTAMDVHFSQKSSP